MSNKTSKKGPLSKFTNYQRFISTKSRSSSHMTIHDRVRFYENKLTLLIAVFGRYHTLHRVFIVSLRPNIIIYRELDLNHADDMRKLKERFAALAQDLSDGSSDVAVRLEHLSNSSDSLLSQSRATDQRLVDYLSQISSLKADVRDLKFTMLDITSSSSSKSDASCSFGEADSEKSEPQNDGSCRRPYDITHMGPALKPFPRDLGDRGEGASSVGSEFHLAQDLAFQTFFRTTNLIASTSHEIFPPLVSEYFTTISAWKMLSRLSAALEEERNSLLPAREKFAIQRHETIISGRDIEIACRLIVLRKMCQREGYTSSVLSIETAFDVNESTVNQWEALETTAQHVDKPWTSSVLSYYLSSATISHTSVKVSTWLFTIIDNYPNQIDMHKMVFTKELRKQREERREKEKIRDREERRERAREKTLVLKSDASLGLMKNEATPSDDVAVDLPQPENTSSDDWKQLMLKYWFIDGAGDRKLDNAAESIVAESDATVIPDDGTNINEAEFDNRIAGGVDEIEKSSASQPADTIMIREPPIRLSGVSSTESYRYFIEIPSNGASAKQQRRAQEDLEKYIAEIY